MRKRDNRKTIIKWIQKRKWTVFACYIGLMAILGYAAYEGYIVLQEHLPTRNV